MTFKALSISNYTKNLDPKISGCDDALPWCFVLTGVHDGGHSVEYGFH